MAGNTAVPEDLQTSLLKLVERPKLDKEGNVVTKTVNKGKSNEREDVVTRSIKADEVLGLNVRGGEVFVVTTDGQKFSAEVPAELLAKLEDAASPEPEKKKEGS